MEANTSDASSSMVYAGSTMPFVVFTGENVAAIHLLDLVRMTTSSPALQASDNESRYCLPVPVWYMEGDGHVKKWFIGTGTPPELAEAGPSTVEPELLLSPPGASLSASCAREHIRPLHAALHFHRRSGGLMLENRSGQPIVYEKGGKNERDVTLTKHTTKQTLLWKQKNYLRFGEYLFSVSFVADPLDQAYIDQQFDEDIGRLYGSLPPSLLFNFAPKVHAQLNWHIAMHKPFPNGRIAAGIDIRTGQPLVVKGVSKRNPMARHYIVARLQAMYRDDIGPQEGIMKALDVWCKHGRLSHNLHHEQGELCHCEQMEYSMPIAEHSFHDMPWNEVTADDRIRYFKQTLVGLAKLHEMGITHGHISPTSLLILTEEGRETPASDESLLKDRKAVLSVCMQPTKVRTQSLCVAPELSDGCLLQPLDEIPSESGAQGTGGNEPVGAAPYDDASVSLGGSYDQAMESLYASLNNAIDSVPEVLGNDAVELVHWVSDDTDESLSDVSDGDEWQQAAELQDLDGTEADVWALAVSWLSTLIALPTETRITKDIHSRLLDDLDARTNSSSCTNEKIMALIIRDMLCWDPRARPRAATALQHAAWSVIMMRLVNEEDKKRKRGGLCRHGSEIWRGAFCRVILEYCFFK
ncbi:hypothetical protein J3F83DRAFT_764035 [Trichoderma novae-zelandiae]